MAGDDVEDDGGFGQPLPPDDRLWRHPSEMFALGATAPQVLVEGSGPASERSWVIVAVAGLIGAVVATGLLAATGGTLSRDAPRDVVERVALSPVVSAPIVRGDRGVIEAAARVSPSVVGIHGGAAEVGSAVAFRDDGHLLTSASLVDGDARVVVAMGEARRQATVVGTDRYTGIAVLRLDGPPPPSAVLGEPGGVEVGEPAIAVGTSAGRPDPLVATGVVSALARRVDRPEASPLHGMLQIDVPVAREVVGGPVLDSRGAVIGIADPSSDPTGLFGFAVPIDVARRVADDIIDTGAARHCWLGIEGADLAPGDAFRAGVPGGAAVHAVLDGSPAAAAGLTGGEVVIGLGDGEISSMDDLVLALRAHRPGDEVVLRYVRNGELVGTSVILGERPPQP
jgi:S1-C subfamily serine protease